MRFLRISSGAKPAHPRDTLIRLQVVAVLVPRTSSVVLQKNGGYKKGLPRTPTYAAIMKRIDTNLTCPRMSPFPTPSICPFLMMFIVSYPLIARRAVLTLKKPSQALTRRFMNRWSCSMKLLRYLHRRG